MSESSLEVGRMAPHSQEAEEAVLGSIVINPDAYLEVSPFLKAESFFILRNAWIWEAMERLYRRGEVIDYLTVIEELRTQERLRDIGGAAYITYLSNNTATSIHAEAYGRIVERAYIRRRMLTAAEKITDLAYNESNDLNTAKGKARGIMLSAIDADADDANEELQTSLDEAYDDAFVPGVGVPFGLLDLDKHMSLVAGDYVVFGARKGGGKSRIMFQSAVRKMLAGKRVLIMTTEMTIKQVVWMLIEDMSKTGITVSQLRNRGLYHPDKTPNVEQQKEFNELYAIVTGYHERGTLDIVQVSSWSVERIRNHIIRKPPGYYDWVVVDYLQEIGLSEGYEKTDHDELGHRSSMLKKIATEARTIMITASQINREGAGVPRLEHLEGSDKIGNRPDYVIVMWRKSPDSAIIEEQAILLAKFVKNRFGDFRGTVKLYFCPRTGKIRDLAQPNL